MVAQVFFLSLVFTPSKADQPLRCIELQEKEGKKLRAYLTVVYKESKERRCPLILDLKPFRL